MDSLVDNGMEVQVQLMYGNQMYTARSGKLPDISCRRRDHSTMMTAASIPSSGPQLLRNKLLPSTNMSAGSWTTSRTASIIGRCGTSRTLATGIPGAMPNNTGSLLAPFVETVHKTDQGPK